MLTTIAEVSVALAGFSGLFVAFSARDGSMSPIERYALLFLIVSSLGAVLLALLPPVLMALTERSEFANWYCVFSATTLLGIAFWSWRTPLRRTGSRSSRRYPWVRRLLIPLQWAIGMLQIAVFVTDLAGYAMYVLALWWLVFVAAIQFIIQIAAATKSAGTEFRESG